MANTSHYYLASDVCEKIIFGQRAKFYFDTLKCIYVRAALTTHELEWFEPWGKLAAHELKCSNRELVYVGNTNVTQSTFLTISNVYIQAVLNAILTFLPRQHVFELNKHSNVNKSPPINIYFLIAGLENKYVFGMLERP